MAVTPQSQSLDALRDQVSAALQKRAGTSSYAYIRDMFKSFVVYNMDGKLYQADYKVTKKDGVTLGDPTEVEVAYKPLGESARTAVCETSVVEAKAYNASAGTLRVRVITPGLNKSKSRYYPASVLKRDHKVFEGVKMFVNHQTRAEENTRPEGDLNQWVANLTGVFAEADGSVYGNAAVIDPPFKAKVEELNKQGLLNELGVSIRAIGEAAPAEVEGVRTNLVESLVASRSVDFVTYPGAGGRVEAIESAVDTNDVDLLSLAQFRERRPDLVALIESETEEATNNMAVTEQQLQEANAAKVKAETDLAEANKQVAALQKKDKVAEATKQLNTMLEAAKLPAAAAERLRTQFKEAETTDNMQAAIDAEKKYIETLGIKPAAAKVTHMGESAVSTTVEMTEAERKAQHDRLVESFVSLGMTKEEAEIAAAGGKRR